MYAAATAPELDHVVRRRGRHRVVSALRSSSREPQRIRYLVNLVTREGDGIGNANGPRPKSIDPDRADSPKEVRALKETAELAVDAPLVSKRIHGEDTGPDLLHGLFAVTVEGKPAVVGYEADSDPVPLQEEDRNEAFPRPKMRSHAADAWYLRNGGRIRYELIFIHYFDEPQSLRRLEEIRADISALETGTEGLLGETIGGGV